MEKRTITQPLTIEVREDGTESRTITGYAVVFDKWSHNLGWFKERIARNAFDGVDTSNVVATFNHNFDNVLARVDSNTLNLSYDETGLKYSFEAPKTTAGNDLLENVRNGNIKGSSFMFSVKKDTWSRAKGEDIEERVIDEVDQLVELGPVTMPAYPDTTAAKRSFEDYSKKVEEVEPKTNRLQFLELKNKFFTK